MKDKFNDILGKARDLPKVQRVGLSAAFAAITAIPVLLMLMRNDPNYQLLVDGTNEGVPDIIQAFEEARLDMDVKKNGSIWVAETDMSRANMLLARTGYPNYAATSYDKLLGSDSLYMSQNKEALLNRQILEENLASAISSIDKVRNAHVRLALASETSFLRSDTPSTASVVVVMEGRETLRQGQVEAIGNLVSSGVRNLPLENVKIIDQHGQLLSNFDDDEASRVRRGERVGTYEREYDKRAEKHLNALYGYNNITVSSTFNVNFDKVTNTTREPIESSVLLSKQSERRYDGEGGTPMGIPGATSNQPPDHADFDSRPDGGQWGGQSNGSEEYINEITNYEVGTSITNTEFQVGSIEEVNVVSIIDAAVVPEEDRQAVIDEMTQALTRLSPTPDLTNVNVIVREFADVEIPEEELNFWQTPQATTIIEAVINKGLVAFIALLAYLLAGRALRNKEDDLDEDEDGENTEEGVEVEEELSYDQLVERLKSLVDEHPKHVSEALRSIMTEKAESQDNE